MSRPGCGATEFVDDNIGAGCGATKLVDNHLGIDPPQVDWAGILQAQDGPWLRGIDRNYIEVSSFFFGIGTEHHVGQVLMSSCDRSVRRVDRILHSAALRFVIALVNRCLFGLGTYRLLAFLSR